MPRVRYWKPLSQDCVQVDQAPQLSRAQSIAHDAAAQCAEHLATSLRCYVPKHAIGGASAFVNKDAAIDLDTLAELQEIVS